MATAGYDASVCSIQEFRMYGKNGGPKNKTVENGTCSIDRVIITKRTREVNRHGRSVASRKMRNELDAGEEVQRMTKVDRED